MPLRVAFDMDCVLADFAGAFHRMGVRRRGTPRDSKAAGGPENRAAGGVDEPAGKTAAGGVLSARDRKLVWEEIHATPDFWATLEPIDPQVVAHIHERVVSRRWETFFVTQRPATAGDTVQRQTQRWLSARGFEFPSVIVHDYRVTRGRIAAALQLDFLVDDTVNHCVDVVSESDAKAILVAGGEDPATEANARRLGIEVCHGAAASLEFLDAADAGRLGGLLRRARRRMFG